MIAFGTSVAEPEAYRALLRAGHPLRRGGRLARSSATPSAGPVCRSYNLLLETAAELRRPRGARDRPSARRDHRPALCAKVRAALGDPAVGVVGCVGGHGRAQPRVVGGRGDRGAGAPALPRVRRRRAARVRLGRARPPRSAEVDAVAGFLLVLSPWAVRNVRFDEAPAARLRLRRRLLPSGARRRPQGRRGRRPPASRITSRSSSSATSTSGSRRTCSSRRSGTCRVTRRTGRRVPAGRRPSARPHAP